MSKAKNSFPKIESKTHTLKVRENNDANNKLMPRTYNCDFCGKSLNPWLFSDIYLPLTLAEDAYRLSFGVACCPECRKKRRKITALKGWSIALTVICWVALFFAIASIIMKWVKSPELWIFFLVLPAFIASLIILIKKSITAYERIYAKKYSTPHPIEVAVRYPLWYQMLNNGWKIYRQKKQNDNNVGLSVGEIIFHSIFDPIFK